MKETTKKLIEELNIKNLKRIKEKIKEIKSEKPHTINLIIDGIPIQTQRPRGTKFGRVYVPNAAKNKKNIRKQLEEQIDFKNFNILEYEVKMYIKFYMPIPKNFSKTDIVLAEMKYIRPTTTPDIDNLMKTYMDGLTSKIWLDDGQVIESHSYKYYSVHPRTEIKLIYYRNIHSQILKTYAKKKKENYDMKL